MAAILSRPQCVNFLPDDDLETHIQMKKKTEHHHGSYWSRGRSSLGLGTKNIKQDIDHVAKHARVDSTQEC